MSGRCDVAIVGRGPYGLSLAAHLRAAGIDFRIFGKPLGTWREHMPANMLLKSDGFASNLSAPFEFVDTEVLVRPARGSLSPTRDCRYRSIHSFPMASDFQITLRARRRRCDGRERSDRSSADFQLTLETASG